MHNVLSSGKHVRLLNWLFLRPTQNRHSYAYRSVCFRSNNTVSPSTAIQAFCCQVRRPYQWLGAESLGSIAGSDVWPASGLSESLSTTSGWDVPSSKSCAFLAALCWSRTTSEICSNHLKKRLGMMMKGKCILSSKRINEF